MLSQTDLCILYSCRYTPNKFSDMEVHKLDTCSLRTHLISSLNLSSWVDYWYVHLAVTSRGYQKLFLKENEEGAAHAESQIDWFSTCQFPLANFFFFFYQFSWCLVLDCSTIDCIGHAFNFFSLHFWHWSGYIVIISYLLGLVKWCLSIFTCDMAKMETEILLTLYRDSGSLEDAILFGFLQWYL